eukprot:1944773-Rhodomonas_salina.1
MTSRMALPGRRWRYGERHECLVRFAKLLRHVFKLRVHKAVCGTDLAYGLLSPYARAYGATRERYAATATRRGTSSLSAYVRPLRCPVLTSLTVLPGPSGYALLMRACGTLHNTGTRCAVLSQGMVLRTCYAMCGTELGYSATI